MFASVYVCLFVVQTFVRVFVRVVVCVVSKQNILPGMLMLPAFNYVLLSINLTPRQRKAIEIPEFEIGFSVGRAKRRWMGSLCSRGRGRKDEEYGGGRPLPVRLGASGSSMIGCQIHRPLSEQTQNLRKDKVLGLYSSLHILPSSVSLSCLHTGQYILQENSIHTVSQSVSQSLGESDFQ